jgi:hypothetical protein
VTAVARRDFHFAGHAIRVEGDEAPLRWLHEFVAPQFAAGDTDEPDRTVRLVVDAREHARLAGHGPDPAGRTIACFTLDAGIAGARVWGRPGAAEVAFDDASDVFYRRTPGEPTLVEVIAARDAGPARLALMRAVREYAMLYAEHAGWLLVHAAAVCLGEEAFVIAGPKRAGKTTVLLHALRDAGGSYVANDRVALRREPAAVAVHGIPTIVSIRRDSTGWFRGLDRALADGRYDFRLAMAERDAGGKAPRAAAAATWGLAPPQLCHVLGVQSRASARVAGVLFPRVDPAARGTVVEPLAADQAREALRGALFRSCPADGMFRVGEGARADAAARGAALATELLSRVLGFLCRLGPDAYRDGARWLTGARRR